MLPVPSCALDRAPCASAPAYRFATLEVTGRLRDHVSALIGVEMGPGPVPFTVVPHESMVLRVQLSRGREPLDRKCAPGFHAVLTGIRDVAERFDGAGDCMTLFALLTPLGVVELLESRDLEKAPRIKAPIAELLDRRLAIALEADLAFASTLTGRLERLARWLEARAQSGHCQSPAAIRAARAATRICRGPRTDVETVAREQVVSRRQLERDFRRWLGTSARHLSQVAQLQDVARRARRDASLARIATDAGFADQAHLSRVVRQMTGVTPTAFVRSRSTPMADAFRIATRGATVYL